MPHPLIDALGQLPTPLAVAASGGADSSALLAACAQAHPGRVSAIHINHGLQAAAADFEACVRAQCGQLGVPLVVGRVDARHKAGESPENAARIARWEAICHIVHNPPNLFAIECVAVAQHADDQLETVLLALSRGAGLPGLSAMPARFERGNPKVAFARPWLAHTQAKIAAWFATQNLGHVQDPSNADERFTRNLIRARVSPAVLVAFPHARAAFARSAAHAAQAQLLLDEVAALDLTSVGSPPKLAALQSLSEPRLANVLRYWLKTVHGTQASSAQLLQLQVQIKAATTRGHGIDIKVGAGVVRRSPPKGPVIDWYNP
jgi:tRNA(Ile)-lysidine synthase